MRGHRVYANYSEVEYNYFCKAMKAGILHRREQQIPEAESQSLVFPPYREIYTEASRPAPVDSNNNNQPQFQPLRMATLADVKKVDDDDQMDIEAAIPDLDETEKSFAAFLAQAAVHNKSDILGKREKTESSSESSNNNNNNSNNQGHKKRRTSG
jgi:hypothetical protein